MLVEDHREGAVLALTLNDPARLNVLSSAMIAALQAALLEAQSDTSVRAILLTGSGKAFCAGHDLSELKAGEGSSNAEALFSACRDLMLTLPAMPQPVIALVQGVATAAGCQLVAACDLAIATPKAKFGLNGIDVGLFCSTPMVAASRAMMPRTCFELLVSGDFLNAEDAKAAGLINTVVPEDRLLTEGRALANRIAEKEPRAIALGKKAFYQQLQAPLEAAYAIGQNAILENLSFSATQEKIAAFAAKRKQ
ncbi:MAG: enoyl-CoA hydratase-related protein [Pseudomonadota bacterium]